MKASTEFCYDPSAACFRCTDTSAASGLTLLAASWSMCTVGRLKVLRAGRLMGAAGCGG